jgi:predicted nucleotidyltransferase
MAERPTELDDIRPAVNHLLRQAGADFGILFGSRARHDELVDSDVDLVVVARGFAGVPWLERMWALQRLWKLPVPLEVLPYTPQEWRRRRATSGVLQDALREGIRILPARPPAG